mmetsp:Transcript_44949/g.144015  ORF Transcript_44949/g.144015 Transcript_44949/m.144015 type:complete len:306 (+) Transcript_44949:793-1710(+)
MRRASVRDVASSRKADVSTERTANSATSHMRSERGRRRKRRREPHRARRTTARTTTATRRGAWRPSCRPSGGVQATAASLGGVQATRPSRQRLCTTRPRPRRSGAPRPRALEASAPVSSRRWSPRGTPEVSCRYPRHRGECCRPSARPPPRRPRAPRACRPRRAVCRIGRDHTTSWSPSMATGRHSLAWTCTARRRRRWPTPPPPPYGACPRRRLWRRPGRRALGGRGMWIRGYRCILILMPGCQAIRLWVSSLLRPSCRCSSRRPPLPSGADPRRDETCVEAASAKAPTLGQLVRRKLVTQTRR